MSAKSVAGVGLLVLLSFPLSASADSSSCGRTTCWGAIRGCQLLTCGTLRGSARGACKRSCIQNAIAACNGGEPSCGAALPAGSPSIAVRYVFSHDSSTSGFDIEVDTGFNALDEGPDPSVLGSLLAGTKALVWLGNYDNTTCDWEQSDDEIRTDVGAIAGNPNVAGYYIADEPHVWDCSNAPMQMKARSDLVKSLDPGPPTFVAIEPHDPGNPYTPYVGTADVLGVERYPCTKEEGCVLSRIDDQVALAEQAGIPHYWALVQAFGDSFYSLPTAEELHGEFQHWRASRMEGYLVFTWSRKLERRGDLLRALQAENTQ
jgi:hypothetical protein